MTNYITIKIRYGNLSMYPEVIARHGDVTIEQERETIEKHLKEVGAISFDRVGDVYDIEVKSE